MDPIDDHLKGRLQVNAIAMDQFRQENIILAKHISEGTTSHTTVSFEEKWERMKSTLMSLIKRHMRYLVNIIPTLDNCTINLDVSMSADDRYEWKLVLPEENIGCRHFKAIVLTDTHYLFNSTVQDPAFIDYLSNKKHINKIVILPRNFVKGI